MTKKFADEYCDREPNFYITNAVKLALYKQRHNLLGVVLSHSFWDNVVYQLESAVNNSSQVSNNGHIHTIEPGDNSDPWASYKPNYSSIPIIHPANLNTPSNYGWTYLNSRWNRQITSLDLGAYNITLGYVGDNALPVYESLFEWEFYYDEDYEYCNPKTMVFKLINAYAFLDSDDDLLYRDIITLSAGDYKTRMLKYVNKYDPSRDNRRNSHCDLTAPSVDYTTLDDDQNYSDPYLTIKSSEMKNPTLFEVVGFSIGPRYVPSCLFIPTDAYVFDSVIPDTWETLMDMIDDETALHHSEDLANKELLYGTRGPKFVQLLSGTVIFYSVCGFYRMTRLRYCTTEELFPYEFDTRPVVNDDFLLCEDIENIVTRTGSIYENSWLNKLSYYLYDYDKSPSNTHYTEVTQFFNIPHFCEDYDSETLDIFIMRLKLVDDFYNEPQCNIDLGDIEIILDGYDSWYNIEYLGSNTEAYHYSISLFKTTNPYTVSINAGSGEYVNNFQYEKLSSTIWKTSSPTELDVPIGNVSITAHFYLLDDLICQVGIFIATKYDETPLSINPSNIIFSFDGKDITIDSNDGNIALEYLSKFESTSQYLFQLSIDNLDYELVEIRYESNDSRDYSVGGCVSYLFSSISKYFSPFSILEAPKYEDVQHSIDTTTYDGTSYIIDTTSWVERIWIRDYTCLICNELNTPDIFDLNFDDFFDIDGVYGFTYLTGDNYLIIIEVNVDDDGIYIDDNYTSFLYNGEIIHSRFMGKINQSYYFGLIVTHTLIEADIITMRSITSEACLYFYMSPIAVDVDYLVIKQPNIDIEFYPTYNTSGYPLINGKTIGCMPITLQSKTYCTIFKLVCDDDLDPLKLYIILDDYDEYHAVHYNSYTSSPPRKSEPFYLRYIGTDGDNNHLYCIQLQTIEFKLIQFHYLDDDRHYLKIMTYDEFEFKIERESSDVKEVCYSNT